MVLPLELEIVERAKQKIAGSYVAISYQNHSSMMSCLTYAALNVLNIHHDS